jgi:hypothetical protein
MVRIPPVMREASNIMAVGVENTSAITGDAATLETSGREIGADFGRKERGMTVPRSTFMTAKNTLVALAESYRDDTGPDGGATPPAMLAKGVLALLARAERAEALSRNLPVQAAHWQRRAEEAEAEVARLHNLLTEIDTAAVALPRRPSESVVPTSLIDQISPRYSTACDVLRSLAERDEDVSDIIPDDLSGDTTCG